MTITFKANTTKDLVEFCRKYPYQAQKRWKLDWDGDGLIECDSGRNHNVIQLSTKLHKKIAAFWKTKDHVWVGKNYIGTRSIVSIIEKLDPGLGSVVRKAFEKAKQADNRIGRIRTRNHLRREDRKIAGYAKDWVQSAKDAGMDTLNLWDVAEQKDEPEE